MRTKHRFGSSRLPGAGLSLLAATVVGVALGAGTQPGSSISWVSTDRLDFDPAKGGNVVLRYRVGAPSTVRVRFVDPFGEPIRTIHQVADKPGEQQTVWDGRDETGQFVEPEAYAYTITASPLGEEGGSSEVVYDMRTRTGGEPVGVHVRGWTPESERVVYTLSKPSRVRVILTQRDTGWPVRTLMDWEPRGAGRQEEPWNGWDADGVVEARGLPGLEALVYAFALPENVVIVKGDKHAVSGRTSRQSPGNVPHRVARPGLDRVLHEHALHSRARCYDPSIELSFPEVETVGGVARLERAAALRVAICPEQPTGRASPVPRAAVFIFVDGKLVERNHDGYVPYQWMLDPEEMGPGEHVITGLLGWREDHYGIRHIRAEVAPASAGLDRGKREAARARRSPAKNGSRPQAGLRRQVFEQA